MNRREMRRIILVTLFFGMLWLVAPKGYACFCVTPRATQAFEKAQVIFVGEIVEIIPPRVDIEKIPFHDRFFVPLLDQLSTIRFKVEKSLKGVASSEMTILSFKGVSRCFESVFYTFHQGKKYLVYAEPLSDDPATLTTTGCGNRTAPLSESAEDIKVIEALPPSFDHSFRHLSGNLNGSWLKSDVSWWLNLTLEARCQATDTRYSASNPLLPFYENH